MLPNITLTFVNNKTINLANASGSPIVLDFFSVDEDKVWTAKDDITVPANDDYETSLVDGVYRLTSGANSIVFLIYGNILNHLKTDVEDILKGEYPNKPAKYDFVSLTLLGLQFLGNSTYQNVDYIETPTKLTELAKIAEAIKVATKYCDNNDNTPQSKNTLWK